MKEPDQTPVRPAAVHFEAPTHEPLVAAILITQDPVDGEYKAYLRTGDGYMTPDRHLIALLIQSCELRNLPETTERNTRP
jgi:hypothetical protein